MNLDAYKVNFKSRSIRKHNAFKYYVFMVVIISNMLKLLVEPADS